LTGKAPSKTMGARTEGTRYSMGVTTVEKVGRGHKGNGCPWN